MSRQLKIMNLVIMGMMLFSQHASLSQTGTRRANAMAEPASNAIAELQCYAGFNQVYNQLYLQISNYDNGCFPSSGEGIEWWMTVGEQESGLQLTAKSARLICAKTKGTFRIDWVASASNALLMLSSCIYGK